MRCEKRLQSLYVLNWCHHRLRHIAGHCRRLDMSGDQQDVVSLDIRAGPASSHAMLRVRLSLSWPPAVNGRLSANMKAAVSLAALRDALLPGVAHLRRNPNTVQSEKLVEAVA